MSSIDRRAIVVTANLSYPAGGQVYARRMFDELVAAGWKLAVWTDAPQREDLAADQWHVCEEFFRDGHGISGRLRRHKAERRLLDLVREYRPTNVFVLADVPRPMFRAVAKHTKVTFFLHSATPTCPQEEGLRYLATSGKLCAHRAGLNCLKVDRTEGCLGKRPWWRKVQRIWNTRRGLWALRNLDAVVANSHYIGELYRRHSRGIALSVLEPQVPRFAPPPTTASDENARFTLLYLGRIETYKGALEAVEILAQLPTHYRLRFVGDGSAVEQVRRHSIARGVVHRVELSGWAERERINREISRAGVLLMPGLWAEAFGMAGPEALGGGLPVVAYDVGGVGEWCDGIVARIVRMGDRAAAARQIIDITSDDARWNSLRHRARAYASARFDPAHWRKHFLQIIEPPRAEPVHEVPPFSVVAATAVKS